MNITGRVTADAQVRNVSDSKTVVNFSVAINDSYKNRAGARMEHVTYFDCAYWLSPKVAAILTKGAVVELTGRVSARAWTGSDGQPHAGLNLNASSIKLHAVGRKADAERAVPIADRAALEAKPLEEDVPF